MDDTRREGLRTLHESVKVTASPRWTDETRKTIVRP